MITKKILNNWKTSKKLYFKKLNTWKECKKMYLKINEQWKEIYCSFELPTYTGSHAIFGDAGKGYMEMYTSGTLTLNSDTKYDVHLVGGGGGNSNIGYYNENTDASYDFSGGGGGGYTTTLLKQPQLKGSYGVIIGAGGIGIINQYGNASAVSGGTSSIFSSQADGGWYGSTSDTGSTSTSSVHGGKGGSGGGGSYRAQTVGDGGTDGSNGTSTAGVGQGTTTKDFGTGTLRAGGGGGYYCYDRYPNTRRILSGTGGAGGGGNGGVAGSANTGGGAGGATSRLYGGSGIVILRWGY